MVPFDLPSAAQRKDKSIPTSQYFSEGNGGESRKSYHGYPNGYAQLVHNPATWHVTPMQLDTRNRDCGVRPEDVHNCTTFVPGPEPKQARYGRGIPKDTVYSGILECPCNEGYGGDPIFYPNSATKIVEHNFALRASGSCQDNVDSAQVCFKAAPSLGINASRFVNQTVMDAKLPPACSVQVETNGTAVVYFNRAGEAACDGGKLVGEAVSPVNVTLTLELDPNKGGLVERSDAGVYCGDNHQYIQKFQMDSQMSNRTAALIDARDRCETYCLTDATCWGCSVDCPTPHDLVCDWNALTMCGDIKTWQGALPGDISQKKPGTATITLKGPPDVWFAVGFNADAMAKQPYTLIVNDTAVTEMKIGMCENEGKHCPGPVLVASVSLLSNTVSAGVRTVVMTRGLVGLTKDHYTFDTVVNTIPLITAVGKSQNFAYHTAHGNTMISLASVGKPTCVCDLGKVGKICVTGGEQCHEFDSKHGRCVADGPLIVQKNPTCNTVQYAGGLKCCGHKRMMLDVAQAQESLQREMLRYHFKFRFWFQEYVPATGGSGQPSHYNLDRVYYQTEAHASEYDVPPAFPLPGLAIPGYPDWPEDKMTPGTSCTGECPHGDDCECEHTIQYEWSVGGTRLFYAGGHCHAPSCLSLNLYVNESGKLRLLCAQVPKYGKGNYSKDKFDDKGYITLPPCLWSDDPSEGLNPTEWLPSGTRLVSIKKNRNTHVGHFGEMASWQMRGVHFEDPPTLVAI